MKIFLDMDGVLTNCHLSALSYYGLHIDEYPLNMRVKDILAGNGIAVPADHDVFWESFTEDFWDALTKTDICDILLKTSVSIAGQENVFLATRPTLNPQSYSGKAIWVRENLPEWIWGQVIMTGNKEFLASPDALLVDDHPVNCEKFEAAGGTALLVPRPWNGNEDISKHEMLSLLFGAAGSIKVDIGE